MKRNDKFCSILVKLRIAFFLPFAFFLLGSVLILGIQYKNGAQNDVVSRISYEDEILAQSLEARIQNTRSSMNSIIIHLNDVLGEPYWKDGKGPAVDTPTQWRIYSCMINTFATSNDAEQVMIVWENGVTWYENRTENYSMQKGGEALLQEMKALGIDRHGSWLMQIRTQSQIGGTGYFFAKEYVEIGTGDNLGYVILKVPGIFHGIDAGNLDRLIYLFGPAGNLLYSSDSQEQESYERAVENGEEEAFSQALREKISEKENGDSRWLVKRMALDRGWEMVSVTDLRGEMEEQYRTVLLLLILSLLITAFLYLLINYTISRIVRPVQLLSNHMQEADLPLPIDLPKENDEVGILVSRFNEMAGRNQSLVSLLLEERKRQEELKLSLLQAQIKPHFLYNTLDAIYCLVLMGKNEEGGRMTKLLSDYYRHVLSRGMDWVLLFEEVRQAEDYLNIQAIRYRELLDFQVSVGENVENIKIPKLTLQPLVENAIYHGIKPLGEKGKLRLSVEQQGDEVLIRVEDNGVGLSMERFEEVLERGKAEGEGFGLRNVVERLQLYYRDRCSVELEERERGTSIVIRIRLEQEEI